MLPSHEDYDTLPISLDTKKLSIQLTWTVTCFPVFSSISTKASILNFPAFPLIISEVLGRVTCNKWDASSCLSCFYFIHSLIWHINWALIISLLASSGRNPKSLKTFPPSGVICVIDVSMIFNIYSHHYWFITSFSDINISSSPVQGSNELTVHLGEVGGLTEYCQTTGINLKCWEVSDICM